METVLLIILALVAAWVVILVIVYTLYMIATPFEVRKLRNEIYILKIDLNRLKIEQKQKTDELEEDMKYLKDELYTHRKRLENVHAKIVYLEVDVKSLETKDKN